MSGYTPVYNWVTLEVVTDAAGRYTVPDMQREFAMAQAKPQPGYLAPCSARVWLWSDGPLNVHVVSRATFETSGMPRSMPPLSRPAGQGYDFYMMSGIITERTAEGVVPVAGALVQHFYGNGQSGDAAGYTVSDANGAYVLCDYGDDYGKAVRVMKEGYRQAIQPTAAFPSELNFEVVRE